MPSRGKKKIIYFHLGGLGDSIHDLSVLSQLLEEFPDGQIYYICNKGGKAILRYSHYWKRINIITIDNKIDVILAIIRAPFKADFFIAGCGSNIAKVNIFKRFLFPRTSGASIPDYPNQKLINYWTKVSTFDVLLQPIKGAHRVFTNWRLMSLMGIHGEMHSPKLSQAKIRDAKLPVDIRRAITKDYLMVHHGAASLNSPKRFDELNFSKIIDGVIEKYDLNVVLVGGAQEVQSSKKIISLCKNSNHIVDLTGRMSLLQLMKVALNSKLVLGSDSGPGHIAAALNVPTVSIFGPTDPRQCSPLASNKGYIVYQPVGCNPCYMSESYIKCENNICMKSIKVRSVVQAVSIVVENANYDEIESKCDFNLEMCSSSTLLQKKAEGVR